MVMRIVRVMVIVLATVIMLLLRALEPDVRSRQLRGRRRRKRSGERSPRCRKSTSYARVGYAALRYCTALG